MALRIGKAISFISAKTSSNSPEESIGVNAETLHRASFAKKSKQTNNKKVLKLGFLKTFIGHISLRSCTSRRLAS